MRFLNPVSIQVQLFYQCQNTGHNLNCSINAKHWAQSQLFYQCQTLDTISTILSMPNTGHNLNYSIITKPLGMISYTGKLNEEHCFSIPTNVYLDIYATD